jgi:hypothetical protein
VGIINCFFVFYLPIPYLAQLKEYFVTLSFTRSSKRTASHQQLKEYFVTLSLNPSNS